MLVCVRVLACVVSGGSGHAHTQACIAFMHGMGENRFSKIVEKGGLFCSVLSNCPEVGARIDRVFWSGGPLPHTRLLLEQTMRHRASSVTVVAAVAVVATVALFASLVRAASTAKPTTAHTNSIVVSVGHGGDMQQLQQQLRQSSFTTCSRAPPALVQ